MNHSNLDPVLSYFSRYLAFCPTANIESTYYCCITGITGTRSKSERIVWKSSFFWTTLKSCIYNVCKTSLFNDWKTFGFFDNVTSLEIKSNTFKIQSPAYFSENFIRVKIMVFLGCDQKHFYFLLNLYLQPKPLQPIHHLVSF